MPVAPHISPSEILFLSRVAENGRPFRDEDDSALHARLDAYARPLVEVTDLATIEPGVGWRLTPDGAVQLAQIRLPTSDETAAWLLFMVAAGMSAPALLARSPALDEAAKELHASGLLTHAGGVPTRAGYALLSQKLTPPATPA